VERGLAAPLQKPPPLLSAYGVAFDFSHSGIRLLLFGPCSFGDTSCSFGDRCPLSQTTVG